MSDFFENLKKKAITFALWWVGWLVVFAGIGVLFDSEGSSDGESNMWALAIPTAVLAIICMTPLPKKFFSWLWEKIKEGWQKLMEKKKK